LQGFGIPTFEKQCRTGVPGSKAPANLDVFLESDSATLAIESKFTEHLTPKRARFSNSYQKESLPHVEDQWWEALARSRAAKPQHLDVAQLIKHYLGLRYEGLPGSSKSVTLLYLFWEPSNAADFEAFAIHRREIAAFEQQVLGSSVRFMAMSYPDLWAEWSGEPSLVTHLANLRHRYGVSI
jgi:hypothetical protein